MPNRFKYSTEGAILCIIIGDVHQFIGNCLIPLDPFKGILRGQGVILMYSTIDDILILPTNKEKILPFVTREERVVD